MINILILIAILSLIVVVSMTEFGLPPPIC